MDKRHCELSSVQQHQRLIKEFLYLQYMQRVRLKIPYCNLIVM